MEGGDLQMPHSGREETRDLCPTELSWPTPNALAFKALQSRS